MQRSEALTNIEAVPDQRFLFAWLYMAVNEGLYETEVKKISVTLATVQWSKPPAWKVGDSGFVPRCGIQVSKKYTFLHRSLVNM